MNRRVLFAPWQRLMTDVSALESNTQGCPLEVANWVLVDKYMDFVEFIGVFLKFIVKKFVNYLQDKKNVVPLHSQSKRL